MHDDQVDNFFQRAGRSPDTETWLWIVLGALVLGLLLGRGARVQTPGARGLPARNAGPAPRMMPRRRLTHQLPPGANEYGELE